MPARTRKSAANPAEKPSPNVDKSAHASTSTSAPSADHPRPTSEPFPLWSDLNWQPVLRHPGLSPNKISATIALPFRDVTEEDIPDIIQCFGGPERVAAATRHPQDHSKSISFSMSPRDPSSAIAGIQPVPLTATSPGSCFILDFMLENTAETERDKQKRAKKQLTAVQRNLGVKVAPLAPTVTGVTFRYPIKILFEQDRLYDFAMCPAIPADRISANPDRIELHGIMPYLLPSFPPVEPPSTENPMHYLYFPALRYTNQNSFTGHDCIPSLYTEPLAAHEKNVIRVRRAHAQVAKWAAGKALDVPTEPKPDAVRNITEKVPRDIREQAEEMFRQQPIWVRKVFYAELLKAKPMLLKEHRRFVLPAIGYKFSNGPWSHSWSRFGYNPSENVSARQYQVLDFRVNQALFHPRRLIAKKKCPTERDDLLRKLVDKIMENPSPAARNAKGFYFLVLLRDLVELPKLRQIYESSDNRLNVCDYQEGFFKRGTMEELRLELTRSLYKEDHALAVRTPDIVRLFKSAGLFHDLNLPADTTEDSGDSDDEDDERDGKRTHVVDLDGDVEMNT